MSMSYLLQLLCVYVFQNLPVEDLLSQTNSETDNLKYSQCSHEEKRPMTFMPGRESLAGYDHQSMTTEKYDHWCVCVCECVGVLARSQLKWPLIVFPNCLIVKKSMLACHSSKDSFQACFILW